MTNWNITCPKCKKEFNLDLPKKEKKHEVVCPSCDNKFTIKTDHSTTKSKDEFVWIEHGEPRKTILSSIKPRTNRPMIAAILLTCVFIIGITTVAFSETFITSSLDLASVVGFKGSAEILVTNESNSTIENATVQIGGAVGFTNNNGIFHIENVDLGTRKLEVSYLGYKTQIREILIIPFITSEDTIKLEAGVGQSNKVEYESPVLLILLIFSVFALVAALSCLKRKYLDIALVGSFFGIFSLGFFLIGLIFSIIAFTMIWKSRDEFEDEKKGKVF